MKALDYLYRMKEANEQMGCEAINIDEAIEELEALQNRSCDNCIHNKEQDDFLIFCDQEITKDGTKMKWHGFTKDFCCKYWESK